MLGTTFNNDEFVNFSNHQWTLLHKASRKGHIEFVKYLIEKGTYVNGVWGPESLEHRMNVFTLIENFNDPFYQRYCGQGYITKPQISILIENGML